MVNRHYGERSTFMSQERFVTSAHSTTLLPPKDILDMLSVDTVDEVEVSVLDRTRTLTIRPLDEFRRAQKLNAAIEDVFETRKHAFEELAKGAE